MAVLGGAKGAMIPGCALFVSQGGHAAKRKGILIGISYIILGLHL